MKVPVLAIVCLFLIFSKGYAQNIQGDRHLEVSLRMVGHQILLNSGDSISRVMPIVKENDQYRIQFQSEFEFIPQDLVNTVNKTLMEAGIRESYILQVEQCESKEVVYSYEMNDSEKMDIIPCKGRLQPKECYSILFSLIDTKDSLSGLNNEETGVILTGNNRLSYFLFGSIIGLMAIVIIILLRKRNRKSINDPNIISLGEYQFDKRNTELLYDQKRIELTSKEADLLILLYDAANTTIERDVILKMVWGDEGDYVGRTLDVFISKLRKKLQDNSSVKIVNIRGVGYKLIMDV